MSAGPSSCTEIDAAQAAQWLDPLTDLVIKAGQAIVAISHRNFQTTGKRDGTPVTEADLAADGIIAEGLARLFPSVPTLSEERAAPPYPPFDQCFFCIDPLDGTREFVAGRNEFTVNLALVVHRRPLLGIIGAPAMGVLWRGIVGRGADRILIDAEGHRREIGAIATRKPKDAAVPWQVAVSRSHGDAATEALIAALPGGAIRETLGSAVKFGRVADGSIDLYPRLAPTCEWDIAAGHAIIEAAGGRITDRHGAALQFGNFERNFLVPDFIASGDPDAALV